MDDCYGLVEVVSHLETDPVTVHQMCLPGIGEEIFSSLQSNKVELSPLIEFDSLCGSVCASQIATISFTGISD
jgi:hypothetical protein